MNPQKHIHTEEERLEEAESHRELEISYWAGKIEENKKSMNGGTMFSQHEILDRTERDFIRDTNPFE